MLQITVLSPAESYGSNCYLIGCDGDYAVIDPSAELLPTLKRYPHIAGHIRYVLLTHAHFDHMLTLDEWAQAAGCVKIGAQDGPSLGDPFYNCYLLFLNQQKSYNGDFDAVKDGDTLPLGSEHITVIDAPGHTRGGVCYRVGNALFCGDTVFATGGHGICHVPGANFDVLCQSIRRLMSLTSNDCIVYPGHGPSVRAERLKCLLSQWI